MRTALPSRLLVASLFAIGLAACQPGGSRSVPAFETGATATPVPTATPSATSVTFISDQSAVLTAPGATAQLNAVGPGGSTVTYTSSDPSVATVTSTGTVTAVKFGSAYVTVTAPGVPPAYATVIVATLSAGTVMVPSASVISATTTQAVLATTPVTSGIAVGNLVMSGDRGGLFGKVTSVTPGGNQITLGLDASPGFLDAFRDINVDITLPATKVQPSSLKRRAPASSGPTCTASAGASPSISGQSFDPPSPSITPRYTVRKSGGQVQEFDETIELAIDAAANAGSVSVTASSTFRCAITFAAAALPVFVLPPFVVAATFTPEVGVEGQFGGGSVTLLLPTLRYHWDHTYGIRVDSSGSFSTFDQGSSPDGSLSLSSPSSTIVPSLGFTAAVGPYFAAKLGVQLSLGRVIPLVNLDLASAELFADADVSVVNIDPTSIGYVSPTWDTKIGLKGGIDIALNGEIPQWLRKFGIPVPQVLPISTGNLFSKNIWGNPDTKLSATNTGATEPTCTFALAMTLEDKALVPLDYGGASVTFYAFDKGGTRSGPIGSAQLASTGANAWSAQFTWTAPAAADYTVQAVVQDKLLASLGLPDAAIATAPLGATSGENDGDDPDCD